MPKYYVNDAITQESMHLKQLEEATKHMTERERARVYREAGWWYPEMDDTTIADVIFDALVDEPHVPSYDELRKMEKGE